MEPENYTVIDLEMTGLAVKTDKVIEIGAVRVRGGKRKETYAMLVDPKRPIPEDVTRLTGITDAMAARGEETDTAIGGLLDFIGEDLIVGHNVSFDYRFLKQWAVNKKRSLELYACDTLKIARKLLPPEQPKNLEALCSYFGIGRQNAHRAMDDAAETQQIFEKLKIIAGEENTQIFTPRILQVKAKRQTPATAHQVERLKEFRALHGITEEIFWDSLTRNEASRIMDRYYAVYGRSGR